MMFPPLVGRGACHIVGVSLRRRGLLIIGSPVLERLSDSRVLLFLVSLQAVEKTRLQPV
jgi:hypothetical protein